MKNANGLGGTPTWTELAPTGGPPTPINSSGYHSANDRLIGFQRLVQRHLDIDQCNELKSWRRWHSHV